jgi:hypothetical protein
MRTSPAGISAKPRRSVSGSPQRVGVNGTLAGPGAGGFAIVVSVVVLLAVLLS